MKLLWMIGIVMMRRRVNMIITILVTNIAMARGIMGIKMMMVMMMVMSILRMLVMKAMIDD